MIYYAQAGGRRGPIKIGHTARLALRLTAIKTASPYPISILATEDGGVVVEHTRHVAFAKDRLNGEWFKPSRSLLCHIATLEPYVQPPRRHGGHRYGVRRERLNRIRAIAAASGGRYRLVKSQELVPGLRPEATRELHACERLVEMGEARWVHPGDELEILQGGGL